MPREPRVCLVSPRSACALAAAAAEEGCEGSLAQIPAATEEGGSSPHLLQGAPPPVPVRSRCRRFLNQLLTCVSERPVSVARRRFSSGVG